MPKELSPKDWFFIFLGLLLASYIKMSSAKFQMAHAKTPSPFVKASVSGGY